MFQVINTIGETFWKKHQSLENEMNIRTKLKLQNDLYIPWKFDSFENKMKPIQ
jgi:hypothetical protein